MRDQSFIEKEIDIFEENFWEARSDLWKEVARLIGSGKVDEDTFDIFCKFCRFDSKVFAFIDRLKRDLVVGPNAEPKDWKLYSHTIEAK